MYNNIGNALKNFAIATFIVILISSIVLGVVFVNELLLLCVTIIAAGIVVSIAASMLLHGFGELIVKVQEIEQNTRKIDRTVQKGASISTENSSQGSNHTQYYSEASAPKVEMIVPENHKGAFSCPKCGSSLKKGQKTCLCSCRFDWSNYEN